MTESQVYKHFIDALLRGDRLRCSEISNQLLTNGVSLNEIYEDYIRKALYDIGEMWEYGKLSVASEHIASATAEALINEFYYKVLSGEKNNKSVVVACVEQELHQIGIKMVADVFEMNQWNAQYLGANTPTKDLVDFLKSHPTDLLALSLSLYFNLPFLEKMIKAIREESPGLMILVGGQAFRHGGREVLEKYDRIFFKEDLKSLELFIKQINANG